MEVDGSTSITLAFSLEALNQLKSPGAVMENASKWSDNIGVATDAPAIDVSNYEYDHSIRFSFKSGSRSLAQTLDDSKMSIVTSRHIFISTNDEHADVADEHDWEYLPIKEAAAAAEWELVTETDDITYDGDVFDVTEQIEDNSHVTVPMNTLRWHQVNRGEKNRLIRPVNDEFNTDTITEDGVILMYRGVGEGHKIWGVIQDVETYDSIEAIIAATDLLSIRPHAEISDDTEDIIARIEETLPESDSYITFRVETLDREETEELLA